MKPESNDGHATAPSAARIPADEIQDHEHHQNDKDYVLHFHSKKLQYDLIPGNPASPIGPSTYLKLLPRFQPCWGAPQDPDDVFHQPQAAIAFQRQNRFWMK